MKKFAVFLLISSSVFALEFGQMGNTPASVGGAGVAYKKNAWAIYYNPALLGVNRKASIAYSFSAGYADSNVLQLASIDTNSLSNLRDEVDSITSVNQVTTQSTTRAVSARMAGIMPLNGTANNNTNSTWNFSDLGILGSVLGNLTNKTSGGSSSDLENYLCKDKLGINSTSSGNGANGDCTLQNVAEKLKGNSSALTTIKSELQNAIGKTKSENPNSSTALDILGNLVDNLDPNNIADLVDGIKTGDVDLKTILTKTGGLKISKGTSKAIDSLFVIQDTIDKNALSVTSQNGIAWHISGSKNRGAIGMGVLMSAHVFAGIELDSAHKRIIIDGGSGSSSSDFYEVSTGGNKITISYADQNAYNNSSILSPSANHKLHANGLILAEVPIAYGHTIALPVGELHLGATLKYIFAMNLDNSQKFNFENIDINFDTNNIKQTHTFGIDLGALYTLDWLAVGIVGKNLNVPTYKSANGRKKILPQLRAGASAELWRFTFLADIDLYPNETLNPNEKSQMAGAGVIFDADWIDLRFGVMGNMQKNPHGAIITAGMNIVHFLDIAVQTSVKMVDLGSDSILKVRKMPSYFNVMLGGRYQW